MQRKVLQKYVKIITNHIGQEMKEEDWEDYWKNAYGTVQIVTHLLGYQIMF
jgi:hypothetical protein